MDERFFRSVGDFPVALNEARVGAIEIKAWTERYAAVRLRRTAGFRISRPSAKCYLGLTIKLT
jgi:hypothetical protein